MHRPLDAADRDRARDRLKWDEAFMLQAALAQRAAGGRRACPPCRGRARRRHRRRVRRPAAVHADRRARSRWARTSPTDLACAYPMHRLLQGEVGSGKTVIALRAMLQVVDAGGQAALLAPTEVLAQQHYRSISDMLGPLAQRGQLGGAEHATRVALLTGSVGRGGPPRGAGRRVHRRRRASSSAPTPCSRTRCSSPTSAWSSSTSSTGSAWSSGTRCAPRRPTTGRTCWS